MRERGGAAAAANAELCPDAEMLAVYIEHRLSSDERDRLEEHLVECSDCRSLVVEAATTVQEVGPNLTDDDQAATQQNTHHALRVWPNWKMGSLALVAAAACLVVVLRPANRTAEPRQVANLSMTTQPALATSNSGHEEAAEPVARQVPPAPAPTVRTLAPGRVEPEGVTLSLTESLPTGRKYQDYVLLVPERDSSDPADTLEPAFERAGQVVPWRALMTAVASEGRRWFDGALPEIPPVAESTEGNVASVPSSRLREAAAAVEEAFAPHSEAEFLAGIGLAALVSGDGTSALVALERAATQQPANATIQSALAAAYLTRGSAESGNAYSEAALAAADLALSLEPRLEAPYFTRALALERLRRPEASVAWRVVRNRAAEAVWVSEANSHLARLGELR